MNKILVLFSLLIIFMGFSTALAEEKLAMLQPSAASWYHNNVIFTKGQLTEVGSDSVRVEGDGGYKDIVLNVSQATQIVNAEDGAQVAFASLKKGENVVAYYGPGVSKSMPPQGNAFALVVGKPTSGSAGIYMKAGSIQQQDNESIKVLSSNGDRVITITSDVFPHLNVIREGSELLVWYDMLTMSLPGQAMATKAVLLPATIKVHLGAGVIVANGKELALAKGDIIVNKGKTVLLPLRIIVEALGYNIVWTAEQKRIELNQDNDVIASFKIGSNSYQKGQVLIGLAYAPELVNGKTLVPVEFFTNVLNMKVAVSNSHI